MHGRAPMVDFSETIEKNRFRSFKKKLEQKCIPHFEDIQSEISVRIKFSSHIYIY